MNIGAIYSDLNEIIFMIMTILRKFDRINSKHYS